MIISAFASALRKFRRALANTGGNVAVMTALLSPAIIGGLGLGAETSYWYVTQRGLQNAADEAAIAAATNASTSYDKEAKAVAAQMGFTDGVNNVTVTVSNTAACPGGGNTCYSVTISDKVPLYLAQVVGYQGDTTVNGKNGVNLSSTALAKQATTPRQYCLLALATTGTGIQANGVPFANLAGCNIMSDSNATCNGNNTNADIGDAHATNNGCGNVQHSNTPIVTDPYSGLAANIPADTCAGSYPQEPAKKKDPALPASNQWSGAKTLSGNTIFCGDMQLTADVTITATSNAVLVIENGQLDTNGHTLSTTAGSGLTIIFSGSNGTYTHAPTGGGTLNFTAPTSGTWSGVALYQDPSLTSGVDVSAAGNSPTWDITGLVYQPNANDTFSGAVNKSNNGQSCFAMVVHTVTINGTGSILEHDGCPAAGLTMPTGQEPDRGQLIG